MSVASLICADQYLVKLRSKRQALCYIDTTVVQLAYLGVKGLLSCYALEDIDS